MNIKLNKDLKEIIRNSHFDLKTISNELKITEYNLKKICNNHFEDFSVSSIKDIINRINKLLNENIQVEITEDENILDMYNSIRNKNKYKIDKFKIFIIIIFFFIFINIFYLSILFKDLNFYREIVENRLIDVTITNESASSILVSGNELKKGEHINLRISKNESIIVENNLGVVNIETPTEKYEILLENFEVNLKDGEN